MARIITLGGRKWVIGMQWLTQSGIPTRDELQQEAEELNAPWYATRTLESIIQTGYCAPVDNIVRPRRLASLAAMLADARQQPWLGLFEIAPDVFWYIAVREQYSILPNGDVVGSADEIHAAQSAHRSFGKWNTVEGDLKVLEDLLAASTAKRTKIKSLEVGPVDPVYASIATAAVVLIGGGLAVANHFHAKERLEQQHKRLLALRAEQAQKSLPPGYHELLSRTPSPTAWLASCREALELMPESQYGWILVARGCEDDTVTGVYARGPGATVAVTPVGELATSGDVVTSKRRFVSIPHAGTDTAIDASSARIAMQAWSQKFGVATEIAAPAPLPGDPPRGRTMSVTIPLPISPFGTDHGLDGIPGLRISKLAMSSGPSQSGSGASALKSPWTVSGVIYAK